MFRTYEKGNDTENVDGKHGDGNGNDASPEPGTVKQRFKRSKTNDLQKRSMDEKLELSTQESQQIEHESNRKRGPRRGGPPSEEALHLSSILKKLSREKKWDEALRLYQDTSYHNIRDGHHACIMVDIAARCGRISVSRLARGMRK